MVPSLFIGDYAVIAVYIIAVLVIGWHFSRGENNSVEYLLGGRALPPWAVGLSCMMSVVSTVSMVTVTGEVFNNGLSLFFFSLFTPIIAIPLFFLFTLFYFRLGSFTPYEYLEYRYSPAVRSLISISSIYGRVFYLGSVLYTTSKMFEGAYNWPPYVTISIVGIVGAVYTILGGMKAVVWTDVIQFFVLLVGFIIIVTVFCCRIDGGFIGIINSASESGRFFSRFGESDFYKFSPYVRLSFWMLLIGFIVSQMQLAASDQITIQRFLSTKDWRAAFKARLIASVSTYPYTLVIFFIGLAVFAFYKQNPDPAVSSGDGAFFYFIATQLPSPIPGLFLAVMLAAIMSTLDSGMNSMATVYLKEVHLRFINNNISPSQEVKVSRYATLAVGVIAVVFGLSLEFTGQWLKSSAAEIGVLFALVGEVTLPAFLFAVLSKRANSRLIWWLTAYGFGSTLVHKFWFVASTNAFNNWKPGMDLGWAGKLSFTWPLISLGIGLLIVILAILIHKKHRIAGMISELFAAAAFGVCEVFTMWALYSNLYITDQPCARSFAFNIPTVLLIGWIVLYFCPKQPKKKYQGLTIFTLKEEIIK
jgi:SSS family transporter